MSAETGVLVIHCSDPRIQAPVHDFLHRDLSLDRYALLAVPGGPQFLTLTEFLPTFSWAGWRWVKFLAEASGPERVILIAHEDCKWYRHVHGAAAAPAYRDRQVRDLREACAGIRERIAGAAVELYYARLDRAGAAIERVS